MLSMKSEFTLAELEEIKDGLSSKAWYRKDSVIESVWSTYTDGDKDIFYTSQSCTENEERLLKSAPHLLIQLISSLKEINRLKTSIERERGNNKG